ncbi:MAG: hypothetical protein ACOX77_08770 [Caldicoprobacterales bacterium]
MNNNVNYPQSNINAITPQQNTSTGCETIVHETVCVQGTVTITPDLMSGPSRSFCVGPPIIGECPGELARTCTFTVSQNICVQIPLRFSATASAVSNGVVCGTPEVGPCPDGDIGCTFSIGFFRDNSEFTNSLITLAGGSILLGTGVGLSFMVNTANANDVLSFNVPSPPAPESPPFSNQYQVLYAQLLAAKLNVLNLVAMGAEICEFATNAITAADNFLGASPAGGMAGAPDVQEPLTQFNEGNAPGCPPHCEDDNNDIA